MGKQSALMPKGISWDNAGNWDMDTQEVEVKVKKQLTNRALVLFIPDLKSSLPSLAQKLGWYPRRRSVVPKYTCKILLDGHMMQCDLFRTDVSIHILAFICDLRKPQPPTPFILNNSGYQLQRQQQKEWMCNFFTGGCVAVILTHGDFLDVMGDEPAAVAVRLV